MRLARLERRQKEYDVYNRAEIIAMWNATMAMHKRACEQILRLNLSGEEAVQGIREAMQVGYEDFCRRLGPQSKNALHRPDDPLPQEETNVIDNDSTGAADPGGAGRTIPQTE